MRAASRSVARPGQSARRGRRRPAPRPARSSAPARRWPRPSRRGRASAARRRPRQRPAGQRLGAALPPVRAARPSMRGVDAGLGQGQRVERPRAAGGQQHRASAASTPCPAARLRPVRVAAPAAAAAGSGCARWASRRSGSLQLSSSRAPGGGSSRVLSSALADCGFIASAGCSTSTLARPREVVLTIQSVAARTSPMRIWRLGLRLPDVPSAAASTGLPADVDAQRLGQHHEQVRVGAGPDQAAAGAVATGQWLPRRPGFAQPGLGQRQLERQGADARAADHQQRVRRLVQGRGQRLGQPGQGQPPPVRRLPRPVRLQGRHDPLPDRLALAGGVDDAQSVAAARRAGAA